MKLRFENTCLLDIDVCRKKCLPVTSFLSAKGLVVFRFASRGMFFGMKLRIEFGSVYEKRLSNEVNS